MKMLGIETSCDETAAAVVTENHGVWTIGSNIVASQVNIHREWGGVVPELASRVSTPWPRLRSTIRYVPSVFREASICTSPA